MLKRLDVLKIKFSLTVFDLFEFFRGWKYMSRDTKLFLKNPLRDLSAQVLDTMTLNNF